MQQEQETQRIMSEIRENQRLAAENERIRAQAQRIERQRQQSS